MIACEFPNDASANIIRLNETHHVTIIRSNEEKRRTPSPAFHFTVLSIRQPKLPF